MKNHSKKKKRNQGFPGGPVVKNPHANAGNTVPQCREHNAGTSSIPGPGIYHMLRGS